MPDCWGFLPAMMEPSQATIKIPKTRFTGILAALASLIPVPNPVKLLSLTAWSLLILQLPCKEPNLLIVALHLMSSMDSMVVQKPALQRLPCWQPVKPLQHLNSKSLVLALELLGINLHPVCVPLLQTENKLKSWNFHIGKFWLTIATRKPTDILEPWIGSERALTATLGVIRDWTKQKPSAKWPRLTGSGLGRAREVKELSLC